MEHQIIKDLLFIFVLIYLAGSLWYFVVALDKFYSVYEHAPGIKVMLFKAIEGLFWPVCLFVGCVKFVYRGLIKC